LRGRCPSRFGGRTRADHAREAIGAAPALGLGFDPAEAEATRRVLPRLAELHPHRLVCHFDPRRGDERASLESAVAVAKALGAEPWLKVVVADVEGFAAEIAALDALVQSLVSPFRAVLLSPAADLKSMTPGQAWLPAPPPAEFHRAAQAAFPGAKLGCGMISTFTELNRKRPPLDHLDFIGFTTVALIHACDDASVIEGLEALPSIARSARDIAGHLPIVVGPSAIGLHLNPYGARPVPNSGNRRQAMALNDPRQRARLGAACALGYYAGLARAGVEAVVFGTTTGPFGVVHTVQPWPTPGFDREGDPYPIFFALQSLAALRGANLRALHLSEPGVIDGLAADRGDGSTWSWLISRRMRNRSSSAPGSRRSNHSDSSSAPSERRSLRTSGPEGEEPKASAPAAQPFSIRRAAASGSIQRPHLLRHQDGADEIGDGQPVLDLGFDVADRATSRRSFFQRGRSGTSNIARSHRAIDGHPWRADGGEA